MSEKKQCKIAKARGKAADMPGDKVIITHEV